MHERESFERRAIEFLQKREKVENLRIGSMEVDDVPSTGGKLYKIDAFKAGDPNGPRYVVVLDEDGQEVELEALSEREGKAFFVRRPFTLDKPRLMAGPSASITIEPTENVLVLKSGDTFDEVITVKVPGDTGVSKVDVYFLADTTGSMSGILASVQGGANNILAALNGLGLDMAFGIGNYKDFPHDPFAFQHQQNPTTTVADVINAINAWAATGGGDIPEGQLFALDQLAEAPGGAIGWRPGAKRIILWFGDAPGHDPVCAAISGLPYDITEASATGKLVAQNISVIAISTGPNALDGDPTLGGDYTAACGSAGGSPGQATRIASATGGTHVTGIDEATIVNTIINLVASAATTINNLNLVPTGDTAPFVVSITPAGGYGPLSGADDHVLTFKVQFKGVTPCTDKDQTFKGFLEAIADGVVVARKRVQITVPACRPKDLFSYSVKFVCGVQETCECTCATGVRPGIYATEINIHNYQDEKVSIQKSVLPVVFAGAPQGREPRVVQAKARDTLVLPGNSATMDDCCRLAELLFDSAPPSKLSLTIGFLEIVSPVELQVTAVYTATDLESRSISIDVEQIAGKVKSGKRRIP
jgi:Integrin beta chain VWA domain